MQGNYEIPKKPVDRSEDDPAKIPGQSPRGVWVPKAPSDCFYTSGVVPGGASRRGHGHRRRRRFAAPGKGAGSWGKIRAPPPPAADHSYDPQNRTARGRWRLCSPQCGRASRGSPRVATGTHRILQDRLRRRFVGIHLQFPRGNLTAFHRIPQDFTGSHEIGLLVGSPDGWFASSLAGSTP